MCPRNTKKPNKTFIEILLWSSGTTKQKKSCSHSTDRTFPRFINSVHRNISFLINRFTFATNFTFFQRYFTQLQTPFHILSVIQWRFFTRQKTFSPTKLPNQLVEPAKLYWRNRKVFFRSSCIPRDSTDVCVGRFLLFSYRLFRARQRCVMPDEVNYTNTTQVKRLN